MAAREAWDEMLNWLSESGLIETTSLGYGLLHDDPRQVEAEDCRYDACVEVPVEHFNAAPEYFSMRHLPGGAYSRRRHKGAPNDLGSAIVEMRDSWLSQHDLALDRSRPIITIFCDNPLIVPESQQKIDICAPVKIESESSEDRSAA